MLVVDELLGISGHMITAVTMEQLDTSIADLQRYGLSIRTISVLSAHGIDYVTDLRGVNDGDIMKLEQAGKLVLREVKSALGRFLRGEVLLSVDECIRQE